MFNRFNINFETNLFKELSTSIEYEDVINGRKGAILINKKDNLIPIIRTTTIYNKPCQNFLPIHFNIIENIKKECNMNINLDFNNALIEIYDLNYKNMKFHTDISLDLKDDSYICLFSCYETDLIENRKLVIKNKVSNESSEILLENNSFILFSTETNKKNLHKIILNNNNNLNNRWLGITFRLSKTYIKFINEIPYFYDNKNNKNNNNNKQLIIANDCEKTEFYKYKRLENKFIEFIYPEINYTINLMDTINE